MIDKHYTQTQVLQYTLVVGACAGASSDEAEFGSMAVLAFKACKSEHASSLLLFLLRVPFFLVRRAVCIFLRYRPSVYSLLSTPNALFCFQKPLADESVHLFLASLLFLHLPQFPFVALAFALIRVIRGHLDILVIAAVVGGQRDVSANKI